MKAALTRTSISLVALAALVVGVAAPSQAQYRQRIANDLSDCRDGDGPAFRVVVEGIKAGGGKVRIQAYRATAADWLKKGRWINRIETTARAGTMTFCVPVPNAGAYGIAVRHDIDGDGQTDLSSDGGGMSNNPSINIFNLGKPSISKTTVTVGEGIKPLRIQMRYMNR